jgi:hypothetical protein
LRSDQSVRRCVRAKQGTHKNFGAAVNSSDGSTLWACSPDASPAQPIHKGPVVSPSEPDTRRNATVHRVKPRNPNPNASPPRRRRYFARSRRLLPPPRSDDVGALGPRRGRWKRPGARGLRHLQQRSHLQAPPPRHRERLRPLHPREGPGRLLRGRLLLVWGGGRAAAEGVRLRDRGAARPDSGDLQQLRDRPRPRHRDP